MLLEKIYIYIYIYPTGRNYAVSYWRKILHIKGIIFPFPQLSESQLALSFNQGHSPQESCELVIKEAQQKARTATKPFQMALIAINKKVMQEQVLLLFDYL